MRNALTVDVEDYFQVSAFSNVINAKDWGRWPSRVEQSNAVLLDLFSSRNVKVTFFVLGWVAERYPSIVRDIQGEGHEVACHGMSHQLIYNQTPEEFRQETIRSKHLIEDITGCSVDGYRAASYSITPKSLWALDILADAGFKYDSSIFPVHHDRYGMPGSPLNIHYAETIKGQKILEFPLSSASVFGMRVPVAGGGYFRIYPYALTRTLLRRSVVELDQPFVFYLHPWEIDSEQPRVKGASLLSRFRHYVNISACRHRLERLLSDFEFTTMRNVLDPYHSSLTDTFEYGRFSD